ncbi:MAG: dihydrolipoyl dehydrogenase, partial [Nitrosopumilus sp.]|nr:dihydrolipoyl dehydrogenase [Nitrosopumilus sp.]
IIEKDKMGGTCLNRGCIPTKLLIHSADIAETIKNASVFGINVSGFSVDFDKIMRRVNGITDTDSDNIKDGLKQSENPKLFAGDCKFIGNKRIAIRTNKGVEEERVITAEKILIAAGSKPRIPKLKGLSEVDYITSDEALRLRKQPRMLTFIGGGYIACELAHFFGSLGTEIHIIQRNDVLVPNEDKEISKRFTEVFSKKYNVHLGYTVESISKNNDTDNSDSETTFRVKAKDKSEKILEIDSDQVLVSVGRIPSTASLDLEKTGVKVDEKGFILVDNYLETNVKGIFALGDIIGRYMFKHNANLEAQYAYTNMLHKDGKIPVDYAAMPHAIFTSPQIAGVGFTEQELIKKGMDYVKSTYPYIHTGMGEAIEDRDGFVKFLVDSKRRNILGCHIMGTDASILIHEVLVAMRTGDGTTDSITKTIHIHPALSEVVSRAAGNI